MTRKASKVVSEDEARAALGRIEAGQSNVSKESRALSFRYNGPLRKKLIELIGRDRYFVVIAPRRGCRKKSPASSATE